MSVGFHRGLNHVRAALLLSVIAVTACAATGREPTWTQPRLSPAGWIHDYDYRTDLAEYLSGQYQRARQANATAYVYFYSDTNSHCLGTRRILSRPEMTPLFVDTQVSLLNADRLMWMHDQSDGSVFDPGDWVPVMAKVAPDGALVIPALLLDLPLYHTALSKIHRREIITGRDARERNRQFVEELKSFLRAGNSSTP